MKNSIIFINVQHLRIMINVSVKIKITDSIMKIQLDKPIKSTIFEIWQNIRTDAVQNAPYKSWTLRRSLSAIYKDKWMTTEVGSNLVYAPIQEYGWEITGNLRFKIWKKWVRTRRVRIKPKKYLTRAYNKNIPTIQQTFKKNFDRYITKLMRK